MAIVYSRIVYGAEVDKTQGSAGQVGTIHSLKQKMPGDSVTQDELGVDDETWEMYHNDGVLLESKDDFPDDLAEDESLNRYRMRRAVAELEAASSPEGQARARNKMDEADTKAKEAK